MTPATVERTVRELATAPPTGGARVGRLDVAPADLSTTVQGALSAAPLRFVTAFATDAGDGGHVVRYVLAVERQPAFLEIRVRARSGEAVPSVTPLVPAASGLEREMMEISGVVVKDHPDPRPVLQHRGWIPGAYPLAKAFDASGRGARRLDRDPDYGFLRVEGEGVCEVPVGPIHAGIIEPGHFRFSIAGEPVLHLEIRLGYAHKGVEKLHEGRTPEGSLHLAARTSGDNSVAHAAAFCHAVEALGGVALPPRGAFLRTILIEVERVTHHLGDIGGVLLDVAYNFGASQLAILREDMFRLNARLTGSRLLFGALAVGGVARDLDAAALADARATLDRVEHEADRALKISMSSSSVIDRLDSTGTLTRENARQLAVVGPAARASGIPIDARRDFPHAAYPDLAFRVPTETTGDVMARVKVKAAEIRESVSLVRQAIDRLPGGPVRADAPQRYRVGETAIGVAEAHRGEVVYAVELDAAGRVTRCHVRDPSILNWRALEVVVPNGNIIADFPVVNKSFNLSYSGNDR